MSRRRLYLGRLPPRVTTGDVERFFKGFGRLRDIDLKGDYGFVEFEDSRDADDAVYELNGRSLLGEKIRIEMARNPSYSGGGSRDTSRSRYGPPERTEYRILVENLSTRCSWQDLKDLMRKAGEVTYADAHKMRRNEAIVEFSSRSDMKRAIEKYDGYELHGRRLKVIEDTHGSRSPSRGRKRSRSRSRDRSRSRSRSDSRTPPKRSRKSHSRSRSHSPPPPKKRSSGSPSPKRNKGASRSRSRERSRSRDEKSRSRSRSKSAGSMGSERGGSAHPPADFQNGGNGERHRDEEHSRSGSEDGDNAAAGDHERGGDSPVYSQDEDRRSGSRSD